MKTNSTEHMIGKHLAAALIAIISFSMIAVGSTQAAASVVTLECGNPSQTPGPVTPNNTGQHRLLGIDYSGSTVREYYLDDNGNPAKQSNGALEPGVTHTATITDKIISWSYDWYGQGVRDFTLSRITGKLNSSLVLGNGQVAVQLEQCDI